MLEQEGELLIDLGGVDRVVVVEHEKDIPSDAVDVVDQVGEDRLGRRRLGRLEGGHRVGPAARLGAVQSGGKVEKELEGVVVCLVEGEPGDVKLRILPRALVDPSAEQRGLPESGRGSDEGQLATRREALVQPLDQAGAEDDSRPRWGDIELSG